MGDPEDDDEEEEEEKKKGEQDEEEEENDGEEDEVPWQVTVPDSRGMRATMRCGAPYFPLPPTLCAMDSSRIVPAGHAITPSVARKLPYDSMKDFASIGLIGGQISAFFSGVASGSAQIKAGKVRALGVTGRRRAPTLPDIAPIA